MDELKMLSVVIAKILDRLKKHRAQQLRKWRKSPDDFIEGRAQGYYDAINIVKNTVALFAEKEKDKT